MDTKCRADWEQHGNLILNNNIKFFIKHLFNNIDVIDEYTLDQKYKRKILEFTFYSFL